MGKVSEFFRRKSVNITSENSTEIIEGADFETAISATGFGKFNFILLLIAIPSGWTSVFETTSMSYVFPAAQCDLDLSLENKGMLNAVTYMGMISSGLIWGFLADTLGRKRLLCAGYLLDGVFTLLSGLSQNFSMLVVTKFFGGFIINGPFSAFTSYVSEFHSNKYRARVILTRGLIVNVGGLILPLIAWGVIPQYIFFRINDFRMHSWNFFLIVCSLPSLISSLCFAFMPESPKFLLATDRPEKALEILKRVYALNSGKSKCTYPIKSLSYGTNNDKTEEEVVDVKKGKVQALMDGFKEMKQFFHKPYRFRILLVCVIQFGILMSNNTLRLWLPQIFTAINDYKLYNNGSTASLCDMLKYVEPNEDMNVDTNATCTVNLENDFVYINSMILSSVTVFGFLITTALINLAGKKPLFFVFSLGSGISACTLYFANNSDTVLALASLFISQCALSLNIMFTIIVDLFPTKLRTIAFSLAMICGRTGAISGNLLFPIFLKIGCLPPFLSFGVTLIACSILSLLLPKPNMDNIK